VPTNAKVIEVQMSRQPKLIASFVAISCLTFGASRLVGGRNATDSVVRYTASSQNFANPERGFAYQNDVPAPADSDKWGFCDQGNNFAAYDLTAWNNPLTKELIETQRALGIAVVQSRYHIAAFRTSDLSADYLAFLDRDFETARNNGVKISVKFVYNYPGGGPDAPLDRILRHLDQLEPVLRKNRDVIAYMEAGFIGCWGEWIHSSNGLNQVAPSVEEGTISEPERLVLNKILQVLPKERMVAVRFPRFVSTYFGGGVTKPVAPITAASAFNQSDRSRVGHEENCFVCSESNGSTYSLDPDHLVPPFLAADNLFSVQEGEPGDPESIFPTETAKVDSPLSECGKVKTELHDLHWSVVGLFNTGRPASAVDRWKRDGCYDEFSLKLGYRFRLLESTVPLNGGRGTPLNISMTMANDGYARPYNPRSIEIVFRHRTSGLETVVPIANPEDARLLLPGPAETKKLDIEVSIPAALQSGQYDLLLNLPDPEPSLHDKPAFSIQLANTGVWDQKTGLNDLHISVAVQ
jgi:Domain of unknown function (DUF4832)/Domain of unknown function (DUF4874)